MLRTHIFCYLTYSRQRCNANPHVKEPQQQTRSGAATSRTTRVKDALGNIVPIAEYGAVCALASVALTVHVDAGVADAVRGRVRAREREQNHASQPSSHLVRPERSA